MLSLELLNKTEIDKKNDIKALRVEQVNEPYIGLTQENSIQNSVQDCLPYILKPYGLC